MIAKDARVQTGMTPTTLRGRRRRVVQACLFAAALGRVPSAGAQTLIQSPNPAQNGRFGNSVVAIGSRFAIQAPGENVTYILDAATGSFANTVALPGTIAARGSDLLVGNEGTVVLVDPLTSAVLQTFTLPNAVVSAVAGAGNDVYASTAIGDVVYQFDATTGALVRTLANPGGTFRFGSVLAVVGNYVAVSDPRWATDAGAVHLFARATGALARTIMEPTPEYPDSGRRWQPSERTFWSEPSSPPHT